MGGGARGDLLDFIERIPLAADKEDIGSLLVFGVIQVLRNARPILLYLMHPSQTPMLKKLE